MRNVALGRMLRMVRIRRGMRQGDVAEHAGVSPSVVARQERGVIRSVDTLERHAAELDLRLDIRLSGRAGELVRLADEEHAAIVELLAGWLRDEGFVVELEASFSEWGERGRIDLLACDTRSRLLVIVEVKTLLLDLQQLLGSANVREQLASKIAGRRGWTVDRVVTVLAIADGAVNRSVVRRHPTLFASFAACRLSRRALIAGSRVMVWVTPGRAARGSWIAGKQRVRRPARNVV
jgi:transcriptional regulator with XRE-family HTH domain